MATRGTYLLKSKNKPEIKIYNHWDNYEEGAAVLFADTLEKHGGYMTPENFIRANHKAEIIALNEKCGEEYRYTIDCDNGFLEVQRCSWTEETGDKWTVVFIGPLANFLMANSKHLESSDWVTFKGRSLSRQMFLSEYREKLAELEQYKAKFPDHSGNISSLESGLEKYKPILRVLEIDCTIEVTDGVEFKTHKIQFGKPPLFERNI